MLLITIIMLIVPCLVSASTREILQSVDNHCYGQYYPHIKKLHTCMNDLVVVRSSTDVAAMEKLKNERDELRYKELALIRRLEKVTGKKVRYNEEKEKY